LINTSPAMIIHEIISQHFEEASFLWLLRDGAVLAPHYSLKDLAELEGRVEAHIDGLRIAGDPGWELIEQGLQQADAGGVFAAAVLAFESLHADRMQLVVDAGIATPECSRGLVSALGWLSSDQASPLIDRMLSAELAAVRTVGIAASAAHRRDPGLSLKMALLDDDLLLRTRAAKAVGELGRVDLMSWLRDSLKIDDNSYRFYSAWSATLLGSSAGVPALCVLAASEGPYAERAGSMALRRMSVADGHSWIRELASQSERQRLAVIGAGPLGDPASIPWLIEHMAVPKLARVAGESFSMITGVDISYEDLEGKWPEGFEAGPTENPEDEDVALDPDEDLPWPNPELIDQWWSKNKSRFRSGTRYLLGKPISVEQCQHVLRHGYQRQRAAAAIDLAMLQPGQPLFEVRAPGFRQKQLLGVK
jgi:uncharacterized protein (TIGR02270 family)